MIDHLTGPHGYKELRHNGGKFAVITRNLVLMAIVGLMPTALNAQEKNEIQVAPFAPTMGLAADAILGESAAPQAIEIPPRPAPPLTPSTLQNPEAGTPDNLPETRAPGAPRVTTHIPAARATSVDLAASGSETEAFSPRQSPAGAWNAALIFLKNGGPSIWAIAGLAVITLALILWKIWRLALIGAWSQGKAGKAVDAFVAGDVFSAQSMVLGRNGIRSKVVGTALQSCQDLDEDRAREETSRVAKKLLGRANVGLGSLELIATIAPLLGLLGTVLGMISAFQALQDSGSKADPSLLAGGIWEALLTTAAGMAVAIPASVALTWFEAVIGRIRRDLEDSVTRIFVAHAPSKIKLAAE